MPTAIKEEVFELNLDVSGLVLTDAIPAAGADPHTFLEYPVPVGESLVFTGEDIFALYLYSTDASAEAHATAPVDIVVSDSSKQNTRSLLQRTRYGHLKEFADVDKLCRLDIPPGEQIVVREGERVLIRARWDSAFLAGGNAIDASLCYFRLTCKRIRHTLFD